MALAVDNANLLFDTLTKRFQPLRDFLLLAGIYFTSKVTLKTLSGIYCAFKTFGLPLVWPRNFPKEYGQWAIVTGCSKGIGLSYAHELAKRGMNLILIARKADLLKTIAKDIEAKHNIQVEIIIADFTDDGNTNYENIENGLKNKDIGILVNNVGVNYAPGHFTNAGWQDVSNMIKVNVTSLTLMTKIVLPMMESKKKGAIINIASIAALGPQPFITEYSATKAYNDFFSRGLDYECQSKGITVQCIYPGPVFTDMLTSASEDIKSTNFLVPSTDSYAAQAIRTLGFTNCSTGYWCHSILGYISSCTWLAYWINKSLVDKASKKE